MWAVVNSSSSSWNVVERLCFPAPKPSYDIRSFPDELILIPRDDGVKVPCLFLPFKHARFLIIYFHGNAEDLGLCYSFCTIIRDLFQVHMLAVEYPGYGICPGQAGEDGIMANATAAMRFATDTLHWPCDGIKLLGRSLGTGPTVALAARYDVAGVILVAPFLSIREIFRHQVGGMADFISERFPNHELVGKIESPTLIIHGQQDTLIPLQHGKQIYDTVPAKKMMVCPAQMGHNTSLLANVGTFVLPMTQFFSLPDYTFEDIEVPEWCFPQASVAEDVSEEAPAAAALPGWHCGAQQLLTSASAILRQHEDAVASASKSDGGGRDCSGAVGLPPHLPLVAQPAIAPLEQKATSMAHPPNITPRHSARTGEDKFAQGADTLSVSRAYAFASPHHTPRSLRGGSTARDVSPADADDAIADDAADDAVFCNDDDGADEGPTVTVDAAVTANPAVAAEEPENKFSL